MKLHQRHRIYPTEELIDFAAKQDGCNRFVWNHFVTLEQETGYYLSYYQMADKLVRNLKLEFPFLKECDSQSLQQTLMDLSNSIKNHCRMPKLFNKPKFKKKKWRKSFRIAQRSRVDREGGLLRLPKLKKPVRIVLERDLPEYTMCTIVKEADDRWYACFLVETECAIHVPNPTTKHIGIDLGLQDLIVTSKDERISPPGFFRVAEENIKRKNRALASKTKGSRRWLKCKKLLARAHSKVRHQRVDFIHKVTTKLVNDNEAIAVESLDIHDMSKNHRLSKSILDASWNTITQNLEYKLDVGGKPFTSCMGKYASTQICHACTIKTGPKGIRELKTRSWICSFCGAEHDRDLNAAMNIARQGDQIYLHDYRRQIAVG